MVAQPVEELDPAGELHKLFFDQSPYWTQQWIQKFLTIDNEQGAIVKFNLFPQQIKMLEEQTGKDITIKGRQTRASSLFHARNLRRMVTGFGLKCVVMAQDDQTTATFRARIRHHIRDLENKGIKVPIELDNDDELVIGGGLENRYMWLSGQQNVAGRGISAHIVHLSEVAHYPEEKISALLGAIIPAVPGPPYGWFDMESTPLGEDNTFCDYATDAKPMVKDSLWTTHLYPWWGEPRYRVGTGEDGPADIRLTPLEIQRLTEAFKPSQVEDRLMGQHHLTIDQILWRRIKWKELAKADTPFLQEMVESLESCFVSTSENFFSSPDGVDHLEYYRQNWVDPVLYKEALPYGGQDVSFFGSNLSIWELPQIGDRYCGWLDCAGGGLGEKADYSCFCVLNADTRNHAATLRLKAAPNEVAPMIAAVMKYYNMGMLGGERDAFGATALNILEELGYPNLWYFYDPYHRAEPQAWAHPNQCREKILNCLRKHIFAHTLMSRDRVAVQEMGSFGWTKVQGRKKAQGKKSHDDVVLSLAGASFVAEDYGRTPQQRAQEQIEQVVIGPFGLVVGRSGAKSPRYQPWMR